MFQQILAMPFNKIQYVIANLVTLIIIGLTSATAYYFNRFTNHISGHKYYFMEYTLNTIFALVAGSVFFGSFTIILSTKMKSSETYMYLVTGFHIFYFC